MLLTERLLFDRGADVVLACLHCLECRNAAHVVFDIFAGSFHGDACVGPCYIVQFTFQLFNYDSKMAIYEILQHPDERLSQPGRVVEEVTPEIKRIVENMFETLYAATNCAALAATQLGIPLRITVIDFSEKKDQPLCLINPEVISGEGETFTAEGCMSVANVHEKVKRYERVVVRAMDLDGEIKEYVEDGFMAKCMQHEIDHLNGVLFIDHLSALKRKIVNLRFRRG